MTKVYLLRWGFPHELEPMGIFSSRSKADKQVDRLRELSKFYDANIEEFTLNGTEYIDYEIELTTKDRGESHD